MTQYLAFNQGDPIRLDGLTLPGVVTSIEVSSEFDVERKRLEGRSFRLALARGYKDALVTITLEILPPDELAQVKALEGAFKINYAGVKPKPQRIVNPLLDARGVTGVLFKRLLTRQGNEGEEILCTLEFAEFEPVINKAEGSSKPPTQAGQQALPSGQGGGAGGGGAAAPAPPPFLQGVVDGGDAASGFINP